MRLRHLLLEMTPPDPGGILAYHGTLSGDLGGQFHTGTHFGSLGAAHARIKDLTDLPPEARGYSQPGAGEEAPAVYPARLHPKRVVDLPDFGEWWPEDVVPELVQQGLIGPQHVRWLERHDDDWMELLRRLGYDAVRYPNQHEDTGSFSYIALDPKIVHDF